MEKKSQPKGLVRSFGLKMAIILVMSAVIGSGVFKKAAPMAALLHEPWLVILAWLLSGIIILFGVWSIAELGGVFPHSGGPFRWLEKTYGELTAFLYGWTCFTVVQTAAISSIAFVFAGALETFIPLPRLPQYWEAISFLGLRPFYNIGAKIVSCFLIIVLTTINIRGARNGGRLSFIFTLLVTLSILAIIGAAFGSEEGSLGTFRTVSVHYPAEGFTFFTFLTAMVLAMRSAFWAYEGWIALGFIGEEIKNPQKNLPRALGWGITAIIILYLLINSAYLFVMPIDEMLTAIAANENHIAAVLVIDKLFGTGGAYVISAMILISTFGCTNATILVSARIYYAMARRNLFFKKAAQTHSRYRTPHYALKYQCIWACVLVFSGSFDLLTDLLIITAFIFFGLIVYGVIHLRKKHPDLPRPYKTPGYPFVPVVFVFFCVILFSISLAESPVKSLVGLVFIFSGLPFYYHWKKTLS